MHTSNAQPLQKKRINNIIFWIWKINKKNILNMVIKYSNHYFLRKSISFSMIILITLFSPHNFSIKIQIEIRWQFHRWIWISTNHNFVCPFGCANFKVINNSHLKIGRRNNKICIFNWCRIDGDTHTRSSKLNLWGKDKMDLITLHYADSCIQIIGWHE